MNELPMELDSVHYPYLNLQIRKAPIVIMNHMTENDDCLPVFCGLISPYLGT